MGLNLNTTALLHDWIVRYGISGPLLTLGVQTLDFTRTQLANALAIPAGSGEDGAIMRAPDLFRALGIKETLGLDVTDSEGAEIIFDLNQSTSPEALKAHFGCVLNGGTLEHVFHLPNALATMTRVLRPGGIIIHDVPVHNWVDHGFYQISPTLLFDYYTAAGFEILEAVGLLFTPGSQDPWDVIPVQPGTFGQGSCGGFDERAMLCLFATRKKPDALEHVIPIQSLYKGGTARPPRTLRWFHPYALQDGKPLSGEPHEKIRLGSFRRESGLAWAISLPPELIEGDTSEAPIRSMLALFEDGVLLGPPHAEHALIRARGCGSYSHWRGDLLFSTPDGSDPNENGRCYEVAAPRVRTP